LFDWFGYLNAIVFVHLVACAHAQASGSSRIEGLFVREIKGDWTGMAFSPDGQFLVVLDCTTKSVQVLRASDHSLVRAIGQGTFKNPRRLAISPDGTTVFVSDFELHAVFQYRMDGTLVRQIGSKGQAAGQFDLPRGMVVSKAGELFVADQSNHRVQVFRVSDGTCLRQIGGAQGSGNGQFNWPLYVALSPDETELLVVDLANHHIQVFRARDGQYLRGWGSRGSADGQFISPQSVVVTGSGEVVVADTGNHRVCVFALNGAFCRSIGSQGSGPGQFDRPFLLALSSSSSSQELCVRQNSENRVQFFR
jgi:tripartite motif-containing protein 71